MQKSRNNVTHERETETQQTDTDKREDTDLNAGQQPPGSLYRAHLHDEIVD